MADKSQATSNKSSAGKRQAASAKRPSASGKRQAASGKKPAASHAKTAARPKINSQKSSAKPKTAAAKAAKLSDQKFHRLKPVNRQLPGSFKLFARACQTLARHWKIFVWILVIYALLVIVLVHANLTASSGLVHLKQTAGSGLGLGFAMLIYVLGSGSKPVSSSGAPSSGLPYNAILAIMISLVVIWTLRQLAAGARIRARDGFYKGLAGLVPFILVLLVISLEMLPGILGGFLYGTVINNGIAANVAETVVWTVVLIGLVLVTFYLITSSIFGLYVVTLPDMTPIKALKSAGQLVYKRRLLVLRKVVFLPVALIILIMIIMIPTLLYATAIAPALLFLLLLVSLFIIHSYMYGLYRGLLA
ncbi:MAG: hypothetical protein ACREGA_04535 [Candidatus Saccharimonadales bacterium]